MTDNEKFFHRFILFIVFPVLLGYALFFATCRLYGDAGGYLFNIVLFEKFDIAHSRPASVFIEWLPLLLVKLHVPLKYIIYVFSLTEWLYFFIWYILFSRVFKAPLYGVAIVLAYLFGLRWNYYNPVSELILAFPFAFFLSWFWQRPQYKRVWWYVVGILVSVFMILSHPLYIALIPVLFTYIHCNKLFTKQNIIFAVCYAGIALGFYLMLDNYEKSLVADNSAHMPVGKLFSKLFSIATIIYFVKAYAGLIFLTCLTVFYLIKKKALLQAAIVGGFAFCYFGFVWFKYGYYYPNTFEPFERYIFLIPTLVLALSIPFLKNLTGWQRYTIITLSLWHIVYIGVYGLFVKNRYAVFNNAVENSRQFKENKILYRAENYYYELSKYHGHNWTMNYESILLTAMNGPEHTRQVSIKENISEEFWNSHPATGSYLFGNGDWQGNVSDLNPYYFNMPPSEWKLANTDSIQPGIDTLATKVLVVLDYNNDISADKEYVWDVVIKNPTQVPLYSGIKLQYRGIGYRWKQVSGGKIEAGRYTTPFMCDIVTGIKQQVLIYAPKEEGSYELQLGYSTAKPEAFYPFKTTKPYLIRVK